MDSKLITYGRQPIEYFVFSIYSKVKLGQARLDQYALRLPRVTAVPQIRAPVLASSATKLQFGMRVGSV